MSVLLTLLMLLLGSLPGHAIAGDDDASGVIRFRRVLAPEDRIKDWPLGGGKYLPLDATEFERLLAGRQPWPSGHPSVPAAAISSIRYEARLVDECLVGRASAEVLLADAPPAILPLEQCNLAMAKGAVAKETDSHQIVLGLGGDGKLQAVVSGPGRLQFDWSLAGRRDSAGILGFLFELPAAAAGALWIELPAGLSPEVDHGLVTGNEPTGDHWRRWQIELGGCQRFRLRVLPEGMAGQRPLLALLRESRTYDCSLRGLDLSAQWRLQVHNQPLRRIVVLLDPGLQLISARCGDSSLRWSAAPAADGKGTRVVLALAEPLRDAERVIRLDALGPLVVDRPWRLPRIRAQGLSWQEGNITLLVPEELLTNRVAPVGCGQTGVGLLAAPRAGESLQFQAFGPAATVELSLAGRPATMKVLSAAEIELSDTGASARVAADFQVTEAARLVVEADLAPDWTVVDIASTPAGAVDDWTVQPRPDGSQRLTVCLSQAIWPAKPLRLVLSVLRSFAGKPAKLCGADLPPLRFCDATEDRRLVAARPAGPGTLLVCGQRPIARLNTAGLTPAELALFSQSPQDLLFQSDDKTGGLTLSLGGTAPAETGAKGTVASLGAASAAAAANPRPMTSIRGFHLQSWYQADGAARHRATYELGHSAGGSFDVLLPPEVAHSDVRSVSIDDVLSVWQRSQATKEQRLLLRLPLTKNAQRVAIEWFSKGPPMGIAGSLASPLPQCALPARAGHWTVWLPPGFAVANAKGRVPFSLRENRDSPQIGRENRERAQIGVSQSGDSTPTWARRLLGPFGRQAANGRFDPLSRDDWSQPWQWVKSLFAPSLAKKGLAKAGEEGWTQCRAELPSDGLLVLEFVDTRYVELLGMIVLLLTAAAGCWARGRRPRLLAAILGGFATAALLLPGLWTPVASGGVLGILFSLAWQWTALGLSSATAGHPASHWPVAKPSAGSAITNSVERGAIAIGILLTLPAVGAAAGFSSGAEDTVGQADRVGHAQLGSQSLPQNGPLSSSPLPMYRVLVPIDAQKKPTGGKVYLPEPLYQLLYRRGPSGSGPGWLIRAATYRGVLSTSGDAANLLVDSLRAEYDLQTFRPAARVRIAIGKQGAIVLPGAVSVDGRTIDAQWEHDGAALAFEVAEPGEYRVEVSLQPAIVSSGPASFDWPAGFDLAIPRVPAARLELTIPDDPPAIDVPSACGAVRVEKAPSRLLADLGPTDRLAVRWREGKSSSASGPTVDVDELLWSKILPGSVVIDAKFKLHVLEGQIQQTQLVLDSKLRLLPFSAGDAPAVQAGPASEQSRMLAFRWPRPVSDQVTLQAAFLLSGATSVGKLHLPRIEVLGARSVKRWLAVSVDPSLDRMPERQQRFESVPVTDFLDAWQADNIDPHAAAVGLQGGGGPAEMKPQAAYRLPPNGTDWSVSTRPHEPSIAADQTLTLTYDDDEVELLLKADISTAFGNVFQYRLTAPKGLEIESVSLAEDNVDLANRWVQEPDGTVTIFLSQAVSGQQRLVLRGRLPISSAHDLPPQVRLEHCSIRSAKIRLLCRAGVSLNTAKGDSPICADQPAVGAPKMGTVPVPPPSSQKRKTTTGLEDSFSGRLWAAAIVVMLTGITLLPAPRQRLAAVLRRWPHTVGVVLGLGWWLWLVPSVLGLVVALASVLLAGRGRRNSDQGLAKLP